MRKERTALGRTVDVAMMERPRLRLNAWLKRLYRNGWSATLCYCKVSPFT